MKSIEMRDGDHLHKVAVAGFVLRQQGEMIGGVALVRGPVLHLTRGHVSLASDDRFQPSFRRFLVKFDRAMEIAVVGNRDRRHPKFLRLFHQLLHPHRAIEEGVFGVEMEVNEGIGRHPHRHKHGTSDAQIYEGAEACVFRKLSSRGWRSAPRDLSSAQTLSRNIPATTSGRPPLIGWVTPLATVRSLASLRGSG